MKQQFLFLFIPAVAISTMAFALWRDYRQQKQEEAKLFKPKAFDVNQNKWIDV